MDKITLNLIIRNQDFSGEDYYVIGNCKDLGDWRKTNKMNIVHSTSFPYTPMTDDRGSNFKIFSVNF